MRKSTRRNFVKKTAVAAAAAGAMGTAAARKAVAEIRPEQTAQVLYRETKAWKQYYETLK